MFLIAAILIEVFLVAACILILFNLRDKLGLAPLYILLGCFQYFQVNLENAVSFKFMGEYPIFPGSVILFSALLFAVLLIYIYEGVISARTLILGILISNFFLTGLFEITATQDYFIALQDDTIDVSDASLFSIDYKFFIIGTVILLIDFILLASTYQFLVSRIKRPLFFFTVFLSLWTVLMFDALAFNTAIFYGTSNYVPSLIGHIIGKSLSALLFSIILYIYMTYIDKVIAKTSFIAEQKRDIFSIFTYRKKYLDLKIEKESAEQALTAQFEKIITSISDGIITLDKNGIYTYINKQAAEIMGKAPSSLLGKHIWTVYPDVKELPFYIAFQKAGKTNQVQSLKDYYAPLNKWFYIRMYPSKDGITIYFSDITEQKKTEEALQESEAFNEGVLSSLSAHIAVIDKTGKILAVNKAWNNFSLENGEPNLSRTSIGSNYIKECENAITRGDSMSQEVLEGLLSVLRNEQSSFKMEYPCNSPGEDRWFTLQVVPFGTASDKLVISHTNVTQLKTTERKLEDSNAKLKEAQRLAKIGNWEFNPKTKEVFFSDEMYNILEINKESQEDLFELYRSKCQPEDFDKFNKLVNNTVKNEEGYEIGYYIKANDASLKYIHEICEVVNSENGRDLVLKGTIQDVTKEKLIKDELSRKNEELQKANIELDRFVYSASHDLRAPLTSLRGLIQIVEMILKPEDEELKEPLSLMSTTIDKMDVFIRSIFDYSVNARTEVSAEKINFKELIASVWESLKYMNINSNPKSTINITQEVDFYSDKKRLEIILGNLVSNAIKYYDKDKAEHILNITVTADEKNANILIEDNGIGIGKEHIDKIFEMFYRATKLSTGSGMGMYIVKETIDRLDGTIQIESELHKGTTFKFTIPNANEYSV
ncbi:ATP-binding protein [Sediminicola sp. YIK13]|uniref:ATP-binding protein n=1 Tax=Sediminicola sp. YIK13 TaxID=1453352 RepID=UPI00078225C2|nr:ATP-binding protein [Sediminicola sp. YIK13]